MAGIFVERSQVVVHGHGEHDRVRADDNARRAELMLGLLDHAKHAVEQTHGQRLALLLGQHWRQPALWIRPGV